MRQIADFGGHDRKAFAILLRFRSFNRGVDRKQMRLHGDFLNNRNAFGNRFHRVNRFIHRFAALLRILRRFDGHALSQFGILGGLADIGDHFFHR